jgi:hypothetical protein
LVCGAQGSQLAEPLTGYIFYTYTAATTAFVSSCYQVVGGYENYFAAITPAFPFDTSAATLAGRA